MKCKQKISGGNIYAKKQEKKRGADGLQRHREQEKNKPDNRQL